jgi:hypothetical protein
MNSDLSKKRKENYMKNTHKTKAVPTAEQIAQKADKGEDISQHFTNHGKMMPAIRRVNADFAENMLKELDSLVREMNVSRQAVIKSILRQGLDQHYLAKKKRHHLAAH